MMMSARIWKDRARAGHSEQPMTAAALLGLLLATPETISAPRFEIDPATHLTLIGVSLAVAGGLEAVVRTNAIAPPEPDEDAVSLNELDRRAALDDRPWKAADPLSDAVFFSAIGYLIVDGVLAATTEGGESAWIYASVYAETFAFNWALANAVKVAVKRPRPLAYRKVRQEGELGDRTDDSLSFYSLHTAFVAGAAASATYLAFAETGSSLRSWLTLIGGAILTASVGALRVASGYHFPTDVLTGAAIGSSIGFIVPFLHDRAPIRVAAAIDGGGGAIGVTGSF